MTEEKNINVSDSVETHESLTNMKPWFNGMKEFSGVKVNPAPLERPPAPLGIFIVDSIKAENKIG